MLADVRCEMRAPSRQDMSDVYCCRQLVAAGCNRSLGAKPRNCLNWQFGLKQMWTGPVQEPLCTVRAISPVQSEHTCSEMRYCTHRDQCPWRCVTARQDNQHTRLDAFATNKMRVSDRQSRRKIKEVLDKLDHISRARAIDYSVDWVSVIGKIGHSVDNSCARIAGRL